MLPRAVLTKEEMGLAWKKEGKYGNVFQVETLRQEECWEWNWRLCYGRRWARKGWGELTCEGEMMLC